MISLAAPVVECTSIFFDRYLPSLFDHWEVNFFEFICFGGYLAWMVANFVKTN
jgi:hypothetical protein